jgi:hypothetical protein
MGNYSDIKGIAVRESDETQTANSSESAGISFNVADTSFALDNGTLEPLLVEAHSPAEIVENVPAAQLSHVLVTLPSTTTATFPYNTQFTVSADPSDPQPILVPTNVLLIGADGTATLTNDTLIEIPRGIVTYGIGDDHVTYMDECPGVLSAGTIVEYLPPRMQEAA